MLQRGRPYKYPFGDMEIDDSFHVALQNENDYKRVINGLTSCRNVAQKKTGFKFESHKVFEIDQWVIRIWRVK